MDYAPQIERILCEAGRPMSESEIFARVIASTGAVPSFDDLNAAFGKLGREQCSIEAYVTAVRDFFPVPEGGQKCVETSPLRRLPGAVGAVLPLLLLGVAALRKSYYDVAVFVIGYALLFVFSVLAPGSRLTALLSWNIGIRQKEDETGSQFQLRSGLLVVLMGAILLFGAIWGRTALYESGVARGDQPALEVMLMIPMPLVGVTLLLWGFGKCLKGAAGIASGDDSWSG